MKLYTRTGDDGTTGLFDGHRVGKDSPQIEAYGAIDELNCTLGIAAVACPHHNISAILQEIQHQLFELATDLTAPTTNNDSKDRSLDAKLPRVAAKQIIELEQHIDTVSHRLPPLKQFILPGGSELAARLHLARAVCRRAERRVVGLLHQMPIHADTITYLNRLSDLLFIMARLANQLENTNDVVWLGDGNNHCRK